MSRAGFSAEIHKVANNDKSLALFLGLAFLFAWVVAINVGLQDIAPRWMLRQFEWAADESIPPVFLSMTFASLIAAAGLWVFSGDGNKLYDIDATGIAYKRLISSVSFRWADFERLERNVSTIELIVNPATGKRPRKLVFDISKLDCTGPQLEALIVHYRPDLYRTFQLKLET